MKQSLDILKEIPQFQDNQRQLMLYQDRLEGMTRPHLLAAFNKHETGTEMIDDTISRVFVSVGDLLTPLFYCGGRHAPEATLNFVDVFQKIDRKKQLQQHYYRCVFLLNNIPAIFLQRADGCGWRYM